MKYTLLYNMHLVKNILETLGRGKVPSTLQMKEKGLKRRLKTMY